jgi:hypothetical protein
MKKKSKVKTLFLDPRSMGRWEFIGLLRLKKKEAFSPLLQKAILSLALPDHQIILPPLLLPASSPSTPLLYDFFRNSFRELGRSDIVLSPSLSPCDQFVRRKSQKKRKQNVLHECLSEREREREREREGQQFWKIRTRFVSHDVVRVKITVIKSFGRPFYY